MARKRGVRLMPELQRFSTVSMDTLVTIQIVSTQPREAIAPSVERAWGWFGAVEQACSRFDESSEVMRLAHTVNAPVAVSPLLFECTAVALQLAELTDGAFDPAIGVQMERRGVQRNYKTGAAVASGLQNGATYRDVKLDRQTRTISLRQPLVLDLNAVAKGLAIDLAARELSDYPDLCIEAGGDVLVHGHNAAGTPWQVGIQHPRAEGLLIDTLSLSDAAVCTSGDYERGQHVLDARTGQPSSRLVSVSVVAPSALAADGLSTAAMIVGPERARTLLTEQDVKGLLVGADGEVVKCC